ncbi:MAG: polyprenyl synthetase family protein [Proteobacteria bacterium]|nr:polyprenyl synthetase family protein [Pseudomonadota bacterium]
MDPKTLLEQALERVVSDASCDICPPRLAAAVRHAIFPGGARIRPLLCLAVASACGASARSALAAASSIELLHCASLVHDDLPCFDDADTRRGRPSVHRAYGEPLAVLAGDALIILALESVTEAFRDTPEALPRLLPILTRAIGMTSGLVAGQGWESEPTVPLGLYHSAKTGALFVASVKAGAASAGADPELWHDFGALLGEAYQVADDIRDATASAEDIGKPVGRDSALQRPSAIGHMGVSGAVSHLERLVGRSLASVPSCPGGAELKLQVRDQVRRLIPKEMALSAA